MESDLDQQPLLNEVRFQKGGACSVKSNVSVD